MSERFVYVSLTEPRTIEVSINHRPVAKVHVKPRGMQEARETLATLFRAQKVQNVFCSSSLDFPHEVGFSRGFDARKLVRSAMEDAAAPSFEDLSRISTDGVKPCPLCGGLAYAGPVGSGAWGVTCDACRLVLSEPLPDSWPRGLRRPSKNAMTNLDVLARYLLKRAIERWNRRVLPS